MKPTQPSVSFWLDDFDEIYSDFDSRHYLKRRVSEDFLHELKLSLQPPDLHATTLNLLLPARKRNLELERNVASSLVYFFREQFLFHKEEYRKALRKGFIMLGAGILLTIVNFVLNYKYQHNLILSMIRVLAEPGSWFLIWAGLDILYYDLSTMRKELNYFSVLSGLKVQFQSSE